MDIIGRIYMSITSGIVVWLDNVYLHIRVKHDFIFNNVTRHGTLV